MEEYGTAMQATDDNTVPRGKGAICLLDN